MDQSQRSNYSRAHQTGQELHSSRASSFIFDSQQFMHLDRLDQRQQEMVKSNRLALPEIVPITTPSRSISFEDQLQNQSHRLTQFLQCQQAFLAFIKKFQEKEKLLIQAIQYILTQSQKLQDCKMKVCMFYLTFIYYYYLRNHERMINGQFKNEQFITGIMQTTSYSFPRLKKIIDIDYQTLQRNFESRVKILQILAKRRQYRLNDLQKVLRFIGPNIDLVHKADMVQNLKKVVKEMFRDNAGNVENAYRNITFIDLLAHFSNFLLTNKITLEPPIEIYLLIFES